MDNWREDLLKSYKAVRQASIAMCEPLEPEDFQVQPSEEVSPPKWNLGHTSWFFRQFLLKPGGMSLPVDEEYAYLLNSYYHRAGLRGDRGRRGLRTRPTLGEIYRYRRSVDERMEKLLLQASEEDREKLTFVCTVGFNHEQQHQELFYTEIKNIYFVNPVNLRPVYRERFDAPPPPFRSGPAHRREEPPLHGFHGRSGEVSTPGSPERFGQSSALDTRGYFSREDAPHPEAATAFRQEAGFTPSREGAGRFMPFHGGTFEFGNVEGGWCWDNELKVHKAFLQDFELRDRLVTNAEYLEFIEDGGYRDSLLWLSDGWFENEKQEWCAPLYWEKIDGRWWMFTLSGMLEVDPAEPVCHLSFYEAHAFANWKSRVDAHYKDVRLPSEREWELAARQSAEDPAQGNFYDRGILHPAPARSVDALPGAAQQLAERAGQGAPRGNGEALHGGRSTHGRLLQMLGDVWEWTSSHYEPYPGFREFPDDLSEYNGKFMNNQRVLRGGSCVTPMNHIRLSYRNFWSPATRFQFSGLRLARSLG